MYDETYGGGVAGMLETSWDDMVNAAMGLATQAAELRTELDGIEREWEHLSGEWRGDASSSYGKIWTEWAAGAEEVVRVLHESSELLQAAARAYTEQDSVSGHHISSVDVGPLW